ncbi:DUF1501 domain-containing protein [Vibrio sp. SM6]|uniref:DUF1501 domain-containing protein n=1 Tax=Vibrio agarilyticus TaxID=2726741 RepID=A0A7X8YHQ2_9VIBR|nr:DUF1501 domain-containing protein [Vibrio agarilyticus]NLS13597.1 DUF1501 domain-containing protein [Vibrio agarilyticus]
MVSRRDVLKNMALFSLTAPMLGTASLACASSASRSKALVIVMLDGGNDSAHMVIPTGEHYSQYQAIRPELAIDEARLLPIPQTGFDHNDQTVALGLHPKMTQLAELLNRQEGNVIVNCGVLREPVTKAQAETQAYRLPPFLFSHNSQKVELAKSAAGHNLTTGWVGRLMDVIRDDSSNIDPLFSHAGDALVLRASTLSQNIIRGDNIAKLNTGANITQQLDSYLENGWSDPFDATVAQVGRDAIHVAQDLIDVIDAADEHDAFVYPDTGLGLQCKVTAKLIRSRAALGHQQQVFFLQLSGFDTHANQQETLDEKYAELSDALATFYQHLKVLGLHHDVITMTMSDFGRRIPVNGTGTDHGWGGHQLILGGDVQSTQFIGRWPEYNIDGPNMVERGRLLPTTATDQINIAVARWLGATETAINHVFPNAIKFEALNILKV